MKKLILSIILSFSVLNLTIAQSTNVFSKPHPSEPPIQEVVAAPVLLGMLVLTIGLTAVYVVIKVKSNLPEDDGKPVKLELQKSYDHSNWTPVATNTVVLPCDNAFPNIKRDDAAFYRTRRI